MRTKALKWIEKQIRQTRQALGRAEYKPGVKPEELENLRGKIEVLEFISGAALRAETAKPKWVSVKNQKPETGRKVLLYTRYGYPAIGSRSRSFHDEYSLVGHPFMRTNEITHWMPLPEPPKEEEK